MTPQEQVDAINQATNDHAMLLHYHGLVVRNVFLQGRSGTDNPTVMVVDQTGTHRLFRQYVGLSALYKQVTTKRAKLPTPPVYPIHD